MTDQDSSHSTASSDTLRPVLRRDRRGVLVALVALAVLLPASWWGIPHAVDATTIRGWDVDGVGGIAVLSELNNLLVAHRPDWYVAYPTFHYLLLTVVYAPYLGFLLLTGQLTHPTGAYPYGFRHPTEAIEVLSALAHAVNLAMAIGTVVLAYVIGRTVWDRRAGTLGAVVLLLALPFAFYARTSNLDVPVLFWTAAALLLAIRAVKSGLTLRLAIGLGLTSALAVATKDQAYAELVPILLFVIIVAYRDRARGGMGSVHEPRGSTKGFSNVTWLVVAGVVTFAIAGGIVINPTRFARHIDYIAHFKETFSNITYHASLTAVRPATPAGYLLLIRDFVLAVATAVGVAAAIAGLIGLVTTTMSPVQRRSGVLFVVSLIGFFMLTLVPIRFIQFRYALFPTFVIALCAGALWSRMLNGPPSVRMLGQVWIVVAIALAGWAELDLTWQMLRDTRYAASNWFASAAVPGDTIAYFGKQHQLLYIPAGVTPLELDGDPGAEARLCSGGVKFVYVAADYFTDPTYTHSTFLPDSTYSKLLDDRLGFHRAFVTTTPGLERGPLPYLPYVNPEVQIFTLDRNHVCAKPLQIARQLRSSGTRYARR